MQGHSKILIQFDLIVFELIITLLINIHITIIILLLLV